MILVEHEFCNMIETVCGHHSRHYIHRNVNGTSRTRNQKWKGDP